MRSIVIPRHGPPEVLEIREAPDPAPKTGEVRVRVAACGLNFAEIMARKGLYPDAPKPPMVVGYEAAGTVDAHGSGVGPEAPPLGSRVIVLSRFGAHADTVCVPERQVIPIPDGLDFVQAAAIPVNYLTAYHMLFYVGNLKPGQSLLVHMAAGGVGIAAIQLARTVADITIFGTASARKHDVIRGYGCDHPIDYHTVDYVDAVRAATGGRGVDMVLDALGGDDWKRGYKLLAPAGHLVAFGFANMSQGERRNIAKVLLQLTKIPRFSPMQLMDHNKTVSGVNMGHLWDHVELLRGEMEAVLALYAQGKVRPHIDEAIPFAEAARAHRKLESGANVGKVVLVP